MICKENNSVPHSGEKYSPWQWLPSKMSKERCTAIQRQRTSIEWSCCRRQGFTFWWYCSNWNAEVLMMMLMMMMPLLPRQMMANFGKLQASLEYWQQSERTSPAALVSLFSEHHCYHQWLSVSVCVPSPYRQWMSAEKEWNTVNQRDRRRGEPERERERRRAQWKDPTDRAAE